MPLSARELSQLKKIVALAQSLIDKAGTVSTTDTHVAENATKRIRRTGKDLAAFRKMLKAERKRGVSAADLAKEHGISTAYIYTLR